MKQKLSTLQQLISVMDPQLYRKLGELLQNSISASILIVGLTCRTDKLHIDVHLFPLVVVSPSGWPHDRTMLTGDHLQDRIQAGVQIWRGH
jgi:hypothetical protein